MHVFYCDHFEVVLPDRHPFPMQKYRELRLALQAGGVLRPEELVPAEPAPLEAIRAVHDAGYVDAFLAGELDPKAQKRVGFPWSEAHVQRTLASVGGTLAAARIALEESARDGWSVSGNLAGGTHHAYRDYGSGYCVFNDIAVAATALLNEELVERVLVFDVDVHQGDGTAAIFADDPRVFTTSLHGARNFPLRKQTSDLDVELEDGTSDGPYLEAVERALSSSLERARPEIVFVQAGVDPLAADHLGRLAISEEGLQRRDEQILGVLRELHLPAVLTLGGGYSRPIAATVAAHVGTYRAAKAVLGAHAHR